MAYQQNFKALNGTVYTLRIDGVDIPSGAVTPPLAAEPFTTEEESDPDMFMPTRTQTGYIRMLSMDAATWRTFIPTSVCNKPVTLRANGSIVWQGYVQTGTYGMTLPANYEDIELPVICPLGALDSFDVETAWGTGHEMVSLAQIIYYCFSKLSSLSFDFHFNVGSGRSVQEWLKYRVAWRNFLNESAGELSSRFTCLGLLQELCKLWGWTCRVRGTGIYFTSPTDGQRNAKFIRCGLNDLNTTGDITFIDETIPTYDLLSSDFASTDQTEEYIPGVKKVTVSSELNPYDVLVEIPIEDLYQLHRFDAVTEAIREREHSKYQDPIYLLYRGNIGTDGGATYEDAEVKMTNLIEAGVQGQNMSYGRLCIFDSDMSEGKKNYSWTKCIEIFRSHTTARSNPNIPYFSMETTSAHILPYGVLWIKGRADLMYDVIMSVSCILRVGDRYWNGEINENTLQWVNGAGWTSDSNARCILKYNKSGLLNTKALNMQADYDGTGVPVNIPLSGKIYFAVMEVNQIWIGSDRTNGYFPLMDFEIGFTRTNEDEDANDITYTHDAGLFPETVDVDTIFCSDKKRVAGNKTMVCQPGHGLLMSGNYVVDTAPYGSATVKPEQRTANLIASYGSHVHQVLTLDLWASHIGIMPGPHSKISYNNQTYYPVSISHSWRDDVSRVVLMPIEVYNG